MSIDPESPDPDAPDDALLRRYVLGLTSADESERIDELSVSSPEVATRLQGIEYDLIDAYAAGQLSREALTALRSSYVSQADWQSEVGFSDALRTWHARAAAASPAAPAAKVVSRETPARAPAPAAAGTAWTPGWWLAAAAMIALVALGYLAFENVSLRREMSQAQRDRASLDRLMNELQQRLDAQEKTNAEVAKELDRLRVTNTSRGSVPMVIAAFVLPSALRGTNDITSIALPPNVDAVRLQVPLETARFSTLDADVRDATTNQIVWRGADIKPDGRTMAVTIPASLLKSRTYLLELRGLRPGATAEPLAPNAFKVVIP
jgi:hypothetical protein